MASLTGRLHKEIKMLAYDPPFGISAWPLNEESLTELEAQIEGPDGTPYANGVFMLQIIIPPRYPFEPPKVKFKTPIYHPNIDSAGRICLDTLKMKPKGSWMPSVNLSTLLTTIRVLMQEPNPDDGLMPEITKEYQSNHPLFVKKATESTAKHASRTDVENKPPRTINTSEKKAEVSSSEEDESSSSGYSSSEDDERPAKVLRTS